MAKAAVNTPRRSKPIVAAAIIAVLYFSTVALAVDYTFTWDPNTEPDLAGYKIYFKTGSSGPPYDGIHPFYPHLDSPVDVDNVTEYTLHDLDENTTYCVVVTAYDEEGSESGFSNEVCTADSADLVRSASSEGGEADITGCFIQTSR